jgi:polyketide cyclase/dehydrase/lipid transport protein
LIKALAVLAAIVAGLVVVVAIQPSSFVVERSTAIRAPADIVYNHIDNPRTMDAWSPWSKMDPQMKITYEGPEAGVGASSSWDGPKVGRGRMTITAAKADQEVDIRLEFLAPMRATNRAVFALTPADTSTRVTWRMEGTNGLLGKAFALFMNMDKTVGGDFETGLAALKLLAEADAEKRAAQ